MNHLTVRTNQFKGFCALLLIFIITLFFTGCGDGTKGESAATTPQKMKMTSDIPESIITPDKVKTRIGTLEFFDGIPTKQTAALMYDNLDFLRGVETFLNGIPAASLEAFRVGQEEIGAGNSNQVLLFDKLMDSKSLFLTGNASTVYVCAFLDLKKDGATVLEIIESDDGVTFTLLAQWETLNQMRQAIRSEECSILSGAITALCEKTVIWLDDIEVGNHISILTSL